MKGFHRSFVAFAATAFVLSAALPSVGLGAEKTWVGGNGGSWSADENWAPEGAPGASDSVTIAGANVTVEGPVDVAALTVSGGGKLTVKANGLSEEDLGVFATLETDLAPIFAKLWERATVVNVRGNLTVEGEGSTVYPDADKVSGAPVIFKVGGNFTLGEGASFNAVNRGWGWTLGATTLAGAKTNVGGGAAWTLAPGSGRAYQFGGGYGGSSASPHVQNGMRYGYAYGSSFAPFLPGSCSGLYTQTTVALVDGTRGGGAIVVCTAGTATIDGLMTAMSERHDYSSGSGGSIWLTADRFSFGAAARLTAKAADSQNYEWQGVGGGGRIALAEGYSWAEVETAAGGSVPEGFIEQPTIWPEIVDADVSAAACNDKKKRYEPNPGTLSFVRPAHLPVRMMVTLDGNGSVSYDGLTYTQDFEIDVPVTEAIALTATAAEGNVFSAWYGDGLQPVGVPSETLAYEASIPFRLRVVFRSLAPTSREWTGTVSSDWNTGANWTPAGVPGPNDSVTIADAALNLESGASIASLSLVGAAELTVGGASVRNAATLTLTGDLTVSGGSKLTVYANELEDLSVFATLESDLAPITNAIWNAAKVVTVGGNLTVTGAGSAVYPDAGPVTGVPVIFKVGGNFTLVEGATFNAVERGWGWNHGTTSDSAAKVNTGGPVAWTYAPGAGRDYMRGGGYGGSAATVERKSGHAYGYAYGSEVAPFLPGSCGGLYSKKSIEEVPVTRGGGAIVVFAAGDALIDGTMNVSSVYRDHAGASGGAIYLAARTFSFCENAALTAKGGNTVAYQAQGMGGGGRIALAEGYAWDDFCSAASGMVPAGFRQESEFPARFVTTDVSGGDYTGTGAQHTSNPGTLAYVCSASQPVDLTVTMVGDGTVIYNGQTYDQSFTISVPTAQELTFTAVPAEGAQFVSWGADFLPGTFSEEPELRVSLEAISSMTVTFVRGQLVRAWKGGASGDWSLANNWQPAGLPRETDEVVISNATVTTTGPVRVGKLTLAGSAVLKNLAKELDEPYETTDLFSRPTVISVVGEMRLEGTAKVIPTNDPKTGATVRYDVGSLFVGEGASFDATGTGWFWYESAEDPYATRTQDKYQTRALGAGGADKAAEAYYRGGGYGARGGNCDGKYGLSYGFAYAPFLPGSPNGIYNWNRENAHRPGGTVWIRCAGLATVEGALRADGEESYFGAPSGGSVWLAAKGVQTGPNANISAVGGVLTGNYTSYGAGGRVSLALGLTDEQLAALSADEPIAGLAYEDGVTAIAVDVRGSVRHAPTGDVYGNAGTATTVTGPLAYQRVTVASSGCLAKGVEPSYGNYAYAGGTRQTFAAPEFGDDPDSPAVRYACTGWVLADAAGVRASGSGRVAEVTVENGPLTLTWQWGAAQSRTLVRKPANGSLTMDGEAVDGDGVIWATGLSPVIEVVPEDGYEFVGWEGSVPFGKTWENPLQMVVAEPVDITPVLRSSAEAVTRTWRGTGDVKDASKWEPAGLPGAGDTLVIAGGTCVASNGIRAAALRVAEGATLAIGTAGAVNGDLSVSGDVLVEGTLTLGHGVSIAPSGDNLNRTGTRTPGHVLAAVGGDLTLTGGRVNVYGGPVEGDFTFARGCGFVNVGGAFALEDTSVLALYSDIYTGGSVKITAQSFAVAAGAKVDAASKGYAWFDNVTPPNAPGLGYSYLIGGSHGGVSCEIFGNAPIVRREPYDFARAPTMPGSPNGTYSNGHRPGGGVIRVHAKQLSVDGILDASVAYYTTFGGAAGGSIWLTADSFAFGPNAQLLAQGGKAKPQYASYGAGGRIALGYKMSDERLAALAETGTWPTFRARRQKTLEEFRTEIGNATMVVNVEMGGMNGTPANDAERRLYDEQLAAGLTRGTFVFVDGTAPGMMLIVR